MLGEFDPSELSAVPIRREENNHSRGRADEHGVDKDAQGLHQTLFDGVGRIRRRRSIRHGTHTGFVGKETALNTRHERHAESSPGYCVHSESTLDDQEQNFRNERDVHHGDHRSKEQVSPCHQRHHPSHHSCDAVQAAEDHQPRQNCDA